MSNKILGWGGAIIFLIAILADLGGAFTTVKETLGWVKSNKEPVLSLVNMNTSVGIEEGTTANSGANLVQFQAILRNDGSVPLWVNVSSAQANLGKAECQKDAVDWPKLMMGPSISIELNGCGIRLAIPNGHREEGRMDFQIKYGSKPDLLDKIMQIKGAIAVQGLANSGRFVWTPDGDSALPTGQTGKLATASSGQSSTQAALDRERNESGGR